ncbi:MAG: response regulator [Proteobacteria bacterium]|nr:response regulator [Pseudomonadota bacterium]
MDKPLRVLMVEDSQDDVALVVRVLSRNGYDPAFRVVDRAGDMARALSGELWDLVIADFTMPGFPGHQSLAVFKESEVQIPYIALSDRVEVELAVEAIKAGAADYVLKSNLARLIPAVSGEIARAQARRESRRAAETLARRSKEREREQKEIQTVLGLSPRDLQEPLRKILSFTQRLADHYGDRLEATALDYLERARASAMTMKNLLSHLSERETSSHDQGNGPGPVDLAGAVSEAARSLAGGPLGPEDRVETGEAPEILGDQGRMVSLFRHLLENIAAFRKPGKPLRIKIRGQVHENPSGPGPPGTWLRILVEETGLEIPTECLSCLFPSTDGLDEPRGQGQGFSECRIIVREMGGNILAENRDGGGVAFTIFIPREPLPDEDTP